MKTFNKYLNEARLEDVRDIEKGEKIILHELFLKETTIENLWDISNKFKNKIVSF